MSKKYGKDACPYCGASPCNQRKTPGVIDVGDGFEVHRDCHIVQIQPGWWECDRCGTSIYWDAVDEPPSCNYCPNCGAKVVDEHESHLADLIEPNRGSGGRTILCAHCENASWCGCEPGDKDGGCDFEPSVTEGEPPYNLYSLYEAVLRRRPRYEYVIEDDEVDELIDSLLDICNSPGYEHIQRFQPDEPKVRCVAEVKVDGERLEKLAHDAAVKLTGIDRDALLEEVKELERCAGYFGLDFDEDEPLRDRLKEASEDFAGSADRIREALGVES